MENDREREKVRVSTFFFFFSLEREREREIPWVLFGKEVSWIFYLTGLQGLSEKRFFCFVIIVGTW